jgi:hypothetical protein
VRQNATLFERLLRPSRARLVRPPSALSMPDHWEWATRHATGDFVLVLTDRFVLRPSALALIRELSAQTMAVPLITWDSYCSLLPWGVFPDKYWSGRIETRSSAEVLRGFARMSNYHIAPLWHNQLPRTICNCFHSRLASEIRGRYGRMFFPMSPDYTSAFHLLTAAESHIYIDRPLAFAHGWASNGAECLMRDSAARKFVASMGEADWVNRSPLKIETVTNSLVVDLLACIARDPDRFTGVEIDCAGLWLTNLRELLVADSAGSQKDIARLRQELFSLVDAIPEQQRTKVLREADSMTGGAHRPSRFRKIRGRLSLNRSIQRCYSTMHYVLACIRGAQSFRSPLHAAKATDHVVWDGEERTTSGARRLASQA